MHLHSAIDAFHESNLLTVLRRSAGRNRNRNDAVFVSRDLAKLFRDFYLFNIFLNSSDIRFCKFFTRGSYVFYFLILNNGLSFIEAKQSPETTA